LIGIYQIKLGVKSVLFQFNHGFCPLHRACDTGGKRVYRFVKAAFRFSAKAAMPSF
jgi:hypothetical protein